MKGSFGIGLLALLFFVVFVFGETIKANFGFSIPNIGIFLWCAIGLIIAAVLIAWAGK